MGMLKPIPVVGGGTGSTTAAGGKVNLTVDDYTPGDAANWDPDPTTQPGALDQLAQRMMSVEALGAGASDGAPAYSTASADAQPANLTGRVMDCSSSALVITLPATPSANHLVGACKGAGASTNRLYVRPAGTGKLLGSQQLITLGTQYELSEFQYVDSTYGWLMRRPGAAGLFCPIPSGTKLIILPNGTWTVSGGSISNVKDHSGNGNDLSEATNKPAYLATGINSGPAMDFNGTSSVLAAASALLTSASAFWFALTYIADTVDGNVRTVISQDSRVTGPHRCFSLTFSSTDMDFTVFDGSTGGNIQISATAPSTSTKYTVVGVYDGGTVDTSLSLYVNNSASSTRFTSGTFVAPDDFATPFRVGANYGSGALERFFDGKMNWLIFGTGTPTAAEISAWYTFGNSL